MKNTFLNLLVLLILIAGCEKEGLEEKLIGEISIAEWYNNYNYAISMIWDDSNIAHYYEIAPLFELFNFRTTFGVITDSKYSKQFHLYKELYQNGHEIASHSVSHLDLSASDKSIIDYELSQSKVDITRNIGVIPTTFIHPFNKVSVEYDYLTYEYYLFSRLVDKERDSDAIIFNIMSNTTLDNLKSESQQADRDRTFIIFAGHNVDSFGWEPIPKTILREYLKYVKEETNAWLSTYQNIAIYNRTRKEVSVLFKDSVVTIDDSKIDYEKYNSYGVIKIPITVIISSDEKLMFEGENILETNLINGVYIVSIDLLKGNSFEFYRL